MKRFTYNIKHSNVRKFIHNINLANDGGIQFYMHITINIFR